LARKSRQFIEVVSDSEKEEKEVGDCVVAGRVQQDPVVGFERETGWRVGERRN
jgi:hypothetical protein